MNTTAEWFELLLPRRWWRYRPAGSGWVETAYHFFNLFEGTVWVVLSILVL